MKHKHPDKDKQPKIQKIADKAPTYDGNYVPVSKDYEAHPKTAPSKKRECCHVTDSEKDQMVQSSIKRITESGEEFLRDAILGS